MIGNEWALGPEFDLFMFTPLRYFSLGDWRVVSLYSKNKRKLKEH
jgi:hypothetical protein